MKRIVTVIMMSLIVTFMVKGSATDSISTIYAETRYGASFSLGVGYAVKNSISSDHPRYVGGDLTKSLLSFRFGIFWHPFQHWGVSAEYGRVSGAMVPMPDIADFGIESGYLNIDHDSEKCAGIQYFTVAPTYRMVIRNILLSAEVGLGVSSWINAGEGEHLGKCRGRNELRRLQVDYCSNSMFTVIPRVTGWYILGHHLGLRASLGFVVPTGSSTVQTSLTDVYSGKELSRQRYKISATPVFTAELGLSVCFSSWRRSKK